MSTLKAETPANSITINGILLTDQMQEYLKKMQNPNEGLLEGMLIEINKVVKYFMNSMYIESESEKAEAYSHLKTLHDTKLLLQVFDPNTEEGGWD